MSDNNNIFEPEKIVIVEFKTVKDQVNTPDDFDTTKVEGYHVDNSMQFGFNLNDKLVKVDFSTEIKTESKAQNTKESTGNFHFVFIYHVDNLEELAKTDSNNLIELHPALANALSSVTYSTSRGILLTRLLGTALQKFVLPIINPNNLLYSKKS